MATATSVACPAPSKWLYFFREVLGVSMDSKEALTAHWRALDAAAVPTLAFTIRGAVIGALLLGQPLSAVCLGDFHRPFRLDVNRLRRLLLDAELFHFVQQRLVIDLQ
jgi:hypothetical protein